MTEEIKSCCCCFSVRVGVVFIFFLTIIDMAVQFFGIVESLWKEFLPQLLINLTFCIIFLLPKCIRTMDTYTHRMRMAWYYFFFVAILSHIWTVIGVTGKAGFDELEDICVGRGIADKYYDGDDMKCKAEQRILIIVEIFVVMAIQIYFSFILKTYADEKQRDENPHMSHSHALYQERASNVKSADLLLTDD